MAARGEKCRCSFDANASPRPVIFLLSPEKLYFSSCDSVLLGVRSSRGLQGTKFEIRVNLVSFNCNNSVIIQRQKQRKFCFAVCLSCRLHVAVREQLNGLFTKLEQINFTEMC
jgi:hypothetical protein